MDEDEDALEERRVQVELEGERAKLFRQLEDEHGEMKRALEYLLDEHQRRGERIDELERDRDAWREQAQKLID